MVFDHFRFPINTTVSTFEWDLWNNRDTTRTLIGRKMCLDESIYTWLRRFRFARVFLRNILSSNRAFFRVYIASATQLWVGRILKWKIQRRKDLILMSMVFSFRKSGPRGHSLGTLFIQPLQRDTPLGHCYSNLRPLLEFVYLSANPPRLVFIIVQYKVKVLYCLKYRASLGGLSSRRSSAIRS